MQIRRVVTGHDERGRAVFVSDGDVVATKLSLLPGYAFCEAWGTEIVPTFPDGGQRSVQHQYFPPVGGFRFTIVTIPPADTPSARRGSASEALREIGELMPGFFDFHEPGATGFHKTPSVDIEVMLAGEITLELDDGATTVLRTGDVVVQNGTRHRWINHGDVSATYAAFLFGAYHAGLA